MVENLETENFKKVMGGKATTGTTPRRKKKIAPTPRMVKDLWPMNPPFLGLGAAAPPKKTRNLSRGGFKHNVANITFDTYAPVGLGKDEDMMLNTMKKTHSRNLSMDSSFGRRTSKFS